MPTYQFYEAKLIPGTTNVCDLGSLTKRFKDLFLEGTISASSANLTSLSATNATIGTIVINGFACNCTTAAGTITLTASDDIVMCDGTFTVTLPTAIGRPGKVYYVKNTGVGVITVATVSTQTIDSDTQCVIGLQYNCLEVASNGANWGII